ncbi:succinate dehydrogenase [Gymnodinialimonas ceratoperidinii]|uniref:Succinate dehydrogenase n=1 Tax=Gymnodinialimonas ceratoperidinii TaxID=2856823 RepID=A0A8F6TXD9_9RHOB|nr:succinate dehydrogenase [Gymnodinialimonas ceratoperidinii]QXT40455.1 succinate dehydrogenase [Gymnodinialimonas ceratoperidinii]
MRARTPRAVLRVFALAAPLLLSACVGFQDAADQLARQQARAYVNTEVERRFPGIDATPITNCVIDNASAQEIVTIAGGIALGNSTAASNTVGDVLQRPATLQCTAGNYLDGLLRGLG